MCPNQCRLVLTMQGRFSPNFIAYKFLFVLHNNNLSSFRSIILVLQNWLERYFEEDFYMPPHHLFLKRFVNLAEEYREDKELSDIFVSSADQCDFLTFAKSKLQIAEVKGLQEVACESKFAKQPSMVTVCKIHRSCHPGYKATKMTTLIPKLQSVNSTYFFVVL